MMISDSGRLSAFCEYRQCVPMFARIVLLTLAASVAIAGDAPLPQPPADAVEFTPRYPLWTDGMSKRRWLHVPTGASIDKSDPDAWEFPRGTRAWKEFSRDGVPVETRADRAPRRRLVALSDLRLERERNRGDARAGRRHSRARHSLARRLPRVPRGRAGADPRLQRGAAFDLARRRRSAICTAIAAIATTTRRCRPWT